VVPFVVYAVPQVVGADHSYVVLSGSMEPAIGTGDAVLVQSVDPQQIETGDVITFGSSGDERPTTHRVIGVNEGDGGLTFETKGDNNEDPDASPVPAENVEGTVMSFGPLHSIPLIGYVINFTGTPIGFGALFVVPLVLLVLNEVYNVVSSSSPASDQASVDEDAAAEVGSDEEAADADAESLAESGEEASDPSDAQLTFSASELELGLGILVAFTAYSLWVAYATMEVWSFGVAGSTIVALLLLGGIYANGKLGGGSDRGSSSDDVDASSAASSNVGSQTAATPEGDDD
jgi:signal peptidase